jgi:gliding motility associated protien GldN
MPKTCIAIPILLFFIANLAMAQNSLQINRDSIQQVRDSLKMVTDTIGATQIWKGNIHRERKVIDWEYLREADVFYAKRITRIIDVREKQNQCMQWPKNPLSLILYNAVLKGILVPYVDDSLKSAMTIAQFVNLGSDTDYVETPIDPEDPTLTQLDTIITRFLPEDKIKKYRVLEDWIFDKKQSRMYVRIIAIAPLYNRKIAGIELGEQDLCVLKYHRSFEDNDLYDVREVLVNQEIFNRINDIKITYDDWFEQRLFSSYIIKESNQYDNKIKEFEEFKDNKVNASLESERIKFELFEMEHDLWEY